MTVVEEHKPYVLVIDNDESWRKKLSDFCVQAGCRVDTTANLEEGINASNSIAYDVIVTDYSFPRLPVENLLEKSRNIDNTHAVIFVCEKYSIDDAASALKHGATDFLQKPLDFATFEKSINRAVHSNQKTKSSLQLASKLVSASYQYEFSTAEVGDNRFPLEILDQMRLVGLIEKEEALKLQLVFQEAFTNAVEHGNLELKSSWKDEFDSSGLDLFSKVKKERLANPIFSQRQVYLTMGYNHEKITFKVKDQGPGFLANKQISIHKNDDLQTYGRGLIIILKVMDEVHYSHSGSEVELIKYFKKDGDGAKI